MCFRDTAGNCHILIKYLHSLFSYSIGSISQMEHFACPILLIRSNFVDLDFSCDFCASAMGKYAKWLGGFSFWSVFMIAQTPRVF